MNRTAVLKVVAWSLLVCAALPALRASEDAALPPGALKVSGLVEMTAGSILKPQAARITTPDKKIFRIEMDSRGRSLVTVMHRERVEIWAVPFKKEGADWLSVADYTDKRLTVAHEFWRRMRCNACVALPAVICATPPADLRGAKPVTGRFYYNKAKFLAWARDARFLWAATDNRIFQVDLREKRQVRTYGRAEGLPGQFVYDLASDGKTVWLVYRGGVAALSVASGKIVDLPALRSNFARVHVDAGGAWAITDQGTFRLTAPEREPKKLPALPGAERITKAVAQGVWLPHWVRRTSHLIGEPVSLGDALFVLSYGGLRGLAGEAWTTLAPRGWKPVAAGERLWFLSAEGLNEYDPKTAKTAVHKPPEACRGRYTELFACGDGLWLSAWPDERPEDGAGGLARYSLKDGSWQTWADLNGHKAGRVVRLDACDGTLWALAAEGTYETKPAHPGMTYVELKIFGTSGFSLHRLPAQAGAWESWKLPLRKLETRLICGQDGNHALDEIVPRQVQGLSAGTSSVFATTRLEPVQFMGGYWPCLNRIAALKGASWSAGFEHDPEPLRLQGEQPQVLNISNGELIRSEFDPGDRILEGVGHDSILGLFFQDGTHWALTEGCIGCFDSATGKWTRVVEVGFRYYWDALCAYDDGKRLFIGSDRGLIGRLDLEADAFEVAAALKERSIVRIGKNKNGALAAATEPAPIGVLPSFLEGKLETLAADAAVLAGDSWRKAAAGEAPAPETPPRWYIQLLERRHQWDKSDGNFLWDRKTGKPAYFVKEVFFPRVLCASPDGKRVWLRTFSGLLRLDLPEAGGGP